MIQNINLFPEEFRPKKIILSLIQIIIYSSISLLLVIVSSIGFYLYQQNLEKKVDLLVENFESIQSDLDHFVSNNAPKTKDMYLQAKENHYIKLLKKRDKLLRKLDGEELGYTGGYSEFFIALAKQHVEGLWLTKIALVKKGDELTVKGKMLSSNYIPKYLKKLQEEPIFDGVIFDHFVLTRTEEDPSILGFEIGVKKTSGKMVVKK